MTTPASCPVCRYHLAPALLDLGETTHPACVSELGRGERHLEVWLEREARS